MMRHESTTTLAREDDRDALLGRMCLKCRYDLRGIVTTEGEGGERRCPECGEAFDPATVFVPVLPAKWEWALVGICVMYVVFFSGCFMTLFTAGDSMNPVAHWIRLAVALAHALLFFLLFISFLRVRFSGVEDGGGSFLVLNSERARILHGTVFQNHLRWRRVRRFRIDRQNNGRWQFILRPRILSFGTVSTISVRVRGTPRQVARLRREIRRRIAAAREGRGSE